jgi:hypothetical protein
MISRRSRKNSLFFSLLSLKSGGKAKTGLRQREKQNSPIATLWLLIVNPRFLRHLGLISIVRLFLLVVTLGSLTLRRFATLFGGGKLW